MFEFDGSAHAGGASAPSRLVYRELVSPAPGSRPARDPSHPQARRAAGPGNHEVGKPVLRLIAVRVRVLRVQGSPQLRPARRGVAALRQGVGSARHHGGMLRVRYDQALPEELIRRMADYSVKIVSERGRYTRAPTCVDSSACIHRVPRSTYLRSPRPTVGISQHRMPRRAGLAPAAFGTDPNRICLQVSPPQTARCSARCVASFSRRVRARRAGETRHVEAVVPRVATNRGAA